MSQSFPESIRNYSSLCFPFQWKEELEKESIEMLNEPEIESFMNLMDCTREKAIYALKESENDSFKAKMMLYNLQFELKFPTEKEFISIIGIPLMDECKIWSINGRPVSISKEAAGYYQVKSLEEMIGKDVRIFRRFKLENGSYEKPEKYHGQKAKIISLDSLFRLDSASVNVKTEEGVENVRLKRVCIDW